MSNVLRIKVVNSVNSDLIDLYKNHKAAYKGDCGIDLYVPDDTLIPSRSSVLIDLGVQCALGDEKTHRVYSYDLRSRSSIYKTPLIQQNGVGTVDRDYTGNLMMAVYNLSEQDYLVTKHTRLCQIVGPGLAPIKIQYTSDIDIETERGTKGFGSSDLMK